MSLLEWTKVPMGIDNSSFVGLFRSSKLMLISISCFHFLFFSSTMYFPLTHGWNPVFVRHSLMCLYMLGKNSSKTK